MSSQVSPAPLDSACPVSIELLPPAVQRSVSPQSPAPVRVMAAKGLIPCAPRDLLSAIFILTHDPDPNVAQTARTTAAGMTDRVLSVALRDVELPPEVLAFFARVLAGNDAYLELIILNPSTSDETVGDVAGIASAQVVDLIAQNQLRILRDERIVRGLIGNPRTRASTRDTVLDFCVRAGLVLADVPEFLEARQRILGAEPAVAEELAQAEANTAEKVIGEFGDSVASEAGSLEETRRITFSQRVARMSVSEKIKLASRGNKEARTLLLRDSNKLVALATVQSPRITESEILGLTNSRTINEEVLRYILSSREWMKLHKVKLNLVNNPKCPQGVALRLLQHLHPSELKELSRNKNVSSTLQVQAKSLLQKKK